MCFFLNGISYIAVIFSLTRLKIKKTEVSVRQSGWKSFKEGLDYTMKFTALKKILLTSTLLFFLCFPFTTLLPFFVKNVFHSDVSTLGFFWVRLD